MKVLLFDKNQRVLVLQTADGNWELPGGGWEHGETMQFCIRREIMEELGVGIRDIDFDTMYPYSSKGRTGDMRLKLAVKATVDSDDFRAGTGFEKFSFVSAQELAKLPMVDSEAGIKVHITRIWND